MKPFCRILSLLTFLFVAAAVHAQHGHLNAGAMGTNVNDKLYFANGAAFAAESGYAKELVYATNGTYAGYFQGSITFTALAATTNNAGPAFGAALPGSFLVSEIVSVAGPAGGVFAFWEGGARAPTISVSSGATGTNRFDLSDISIGAGLLDGDPYGHIHGRRFTATKPGEYVVGFKLHDTSENSLDAGPLHAPSDVFFLKFRAGWMLSGLKVTNNVASFSFNTEGATNFYIEATSSVGGSSSWETVAGPISDVVTNKYTFIDTNTASGLRFYRLRATMP